MFTKKASSAVASLALAGLCILLSPRRAFSQLIVTAPANRTFGEGAPPFQMTWSVLNNTGVAKILILASCTITPLGPDLGDNFFFSGSDGNGAPDGHNGLVSADVILQPFTTGLYTYSFTIPAEVEPDRDFGDSNVAFHIVMEDFIPGFFTGTTVTPARNVFAINIAGNPQNNVVTGQPDPSVTRVTIVDALEPGAGTLLFTGALTLFAVARRRTAP